MNLMDVLGLFLRRAMEGDDWEEVEDDVIDSMVMDGYEPDEIDSAISVVERLREHLEFGQYAANPIRTNRLFQMMEEVILTVEARGYLIRLVETGMLDPAQREAIVEKAFLWDSYEVGLGEVQRIARAVLAGEDFNPQNLGGSISEVNH
jgi:Smg protein